MGYYIPGPKKGKVEHILKEIIGSRVLPLVPCWPPHPEETYICVVDNGPFEAAGVAYDRHEFMVFSRPGETRPRTWIVANRAAAFKMAGIGGNP